MDFYNISINMHCRCDRHTHLSPNASSCINRCTHIHMHIIQHLKADWKSSHNIQHILSSSHSRGHRERDFCRASVRRFTFSFRGFFGIISLRTLSKPRHRTQPHRLFGLFCCGGATQTPNTHSGCGTARGSKRTHTRTRSRRQTNSQCTHLSP